MQFVIYHVSPNYNWLYSQAAFSIFKYCMYKPTYKAYVKKIKLLAFRSRTKIYLCNYNNIKAGIIVLEIIKSGIANIIGLAVKKNYRNLGIGKFLIMQTIKLEHLKFFMAQTDFEAVNFYRKCGFKIEPVIKKYNDGDVIRYNTWYSVYGNCV